MIGLIIVVVVVIAIYFLFPVENRNSDLCSDSDGGKDYYVEGEASDGNSLVIDSCVFEVYEEDGIVSERSSILVEGYCEDGFPTYVEYTCSRGCFNGACVS